MRWFTFLLFLFLIFLFPLRVIAEEKAPIPDVKIDMSDDAIKRGENIYKMTCKTCHSMKYLGYKAAIPPESARKSFGKVPPDLSLIAKARGRGDEGAKYIYALLTSYVNTPEKNKVFPNIAMPPPLSKADPQFEQKAKDVAAFLLYAAEPTAKERRRLGRYVLGYMVILTALLYTLNKRVWRDVKKSKKA